MCIDLSSALACDCHNDYTTRRTEDGSQLFERSASARCRCLYIRRDDQRQRVTVIRLHSESVRRRAGGVHWWSPPFVCHRCPTQTLPKAWLTFWRCAVYKRGRHQAFSSQSSTLYSWNSDFISMEWSLRGGEVQSQRACWQMVVEQAPLPGTIGKLKRSRLSRLYVSSTAQCKRL